MQVLFHFLFFLLINWFWQYQFSGQVLAQASRLETQVVFEDDFSAGLEKWQLNTGQLEVWQTSSDPENPFLQLNLLLMFNNASLVPKNQYWSDLWSSYQYEVWFKPIIATDKNFVWGWLNNYNYYALHFTNTESEFYHDSDFDRNFNFQMPIGLIENQNYYLRIVYQPACFQIYLNDRLIKAFCDPLKSFKTGGKIMLTGGTGLSPRTIMQFYKVKVSLIDGLDLTIPVLKQTDSLWADLIYDHADLWSSNPTISRWGCALSSIVMLMKYYALDKMPDSGELITPQILNDWLINQADGYLGDGFLNWLAVTRLIKQISDTYNDPYASPSKRKILPKLEYSFLKILDSDYHDITAQLKKNQPVIGDIGGHFLLIDGYKDDDLLIKDPAYAYDFLSEHSSPLQSVRIFTPSQTDLSYWLFLYPDNFDLRVLDSQGVEVNGFIEQNKLQAYSDQELQSSSLVAHYFPKPTAGEYQLLFKRNSQSSVDLTLKALLYDQAAEVEELNLQVPSQSISQDQISIDLNYQADGSSLTVSEAPVLEADDCQNTGLDFEDSQLSLWRQVLKNFFLRKKLKKYYLYQRLDSLACYAQKLDELWAEHYQFYLNCLLTKSQAFISDSALAQLQAFLKAENLKDSL